MKTIQGKHTSAKVFVETLNQAEQQELYNICNSELFADSKIAVMPDVSYAGQYCLVGFTQTRGKYMLPQVLGADLACGVSTFKTDTKTVDLAKADSMIKELFSNTKLAKLNIDCEEVFGKNYKQMLKKIDMPESQFLGQIYTIGNGNHFLELNIDREDFIYITIHSGSRMLGGKIFKYFTKDAGKVVFNKDLFNLKLADIKREHTGKEIAAKVAELKKECTYINPIYVEDVEEYVEYMRLANKYAALNRRSIAEYIAKSVLDDAKIVDYIESIHNYYDTSDNILRKGAISAKLNERIVIPLNMAEGVVIARGLGNSDYNYSCAHGLGRHKSRSQAKKEITLSEFKESMQHVYSTSVVASTIDESPMAYKTYEEVFAHLKNTIEVIEILKPILNVKGV